MLKVKGIRLLKELSKYLLILVIAAAAGYLAGHWGTGSPSVPQQPASGSREPAYQPIPAYVDPVTGERQPWLVPTLRPPTPVVSLEARLAKLERRVDGLRGEVGTNLGRSLESRVSSLESRVSSLGSQVGAGSGLGGYGSLERRLSDLEARTGRGY